MTDEQKKKCHEIIHGSSVAAAAVGSGSVAIPVVGSFLSLMDESAITPIQIAMIMSLGKVFDNSMSKKATASLLTSMVAAKTGRKIAGFFSGLVPVLGPIVNGGTAASITEAIGWATVAYFQKSEEKKNEL